MNNLLQRLFWIKPPAPTQPVPPGLYHFMRPTGNAMARFHLRVEPDFGGLLLANASAAAQLSPTGVLIARCLLENASDDAVLRKLQANFKGLTLAAAQQDIASVKSILTRLTASDADYPVLNLAESPVTGRPTQLLAPWRADVPLAEPERMRPIIERLWAAGIPHITVLVPVGFEAAHLIKAIERAEDTGLIAGVRVRASDLGRHLVKDLAQAGVDHIDVYLGAFYDLPQPTVNYAASTVHDPLFGAGDAAAIRPALEAIQQAEVCPVAVLPLVESTLDTIDETLAALHQMNVTNASFYAIAAPDDLPADQRGGALSARSIPQVAVLVETNADAANVRYVWEPPVERDPRLSLAAQVQAGPRCAGDAAVRVEPDGRIFAARGPAASVGNLLTDSWEKIWYNAVFNHYRERVTAVTRCDTCPGLALCAADCPRDRAGWAQGAGNT